jgi:hypothetical protein
MRAGAAVAFFSMAGSGRCIPGAWCPSVRGQGRRNIRRLADIARPRGGNDRPVEIRMVSGRAILLRGR